MEARMLRQNRVLFGCGEKWRAGVLWCGLGRGAGVCIAGCRDPGIACDRPWSPAMEGSECSDGGSRSIQLGVNRLHSGRISKVLKRNLIHHPKHHQQQQQQQAEVYNIDKNDFRNIVQKLTGSPAAELAPPSAPALSNPSVNNNPRITSPKPPNPRLQRVRPPPLEPVFSFNKLMPNPAPLAPVSFPTDSNFGTSSAAPSPFFSPLPPLTPGDAVWANTADSPANPTVPRHDMAVSPGTLQMSQLAHWSAVQFQLPPRSPLLPSPAGQLASGSSLPLPLPSPSQGSQLSYPQSSHIPFLFPSSPSSQFDFLGGTGLLPLSPGSLFPFSSF